MASIVRVKRSTGTAAPGSLNFGELGLTVGVGTHGNKGGRLFAGDNSSNVQEIGGRYYTDMLSIAPGLVQGQVNPTTNTNGFVPVLSHGYNGYVGDGSSLANLPRVDQWTVDNITLNANSIHTSDANGDLILDCHGTGEVIIPDDSFLTFGTDKNAKIEYDENGTDKVLVTGASWQFNTGIGLTGGMTIDNIQIKQDTIASTSGNVMYIDPYPDGLSSEGLLIVKGSLQVDGTTTTVNSTNATLNDPIMHVGDVTSTLTVMTYNVAVGVSTITVDSVAGINTGDTIAAAGLPNSGLTTVTAYNTSTNVITYTGVSTAGISTGGQITVTHAFDTNTDRGLSFTYNTSTGSGNNKTGFFGYIDGAGAAANGGNTNVPARAWTYIPEATVTGNTAEGVRGFLDIKGIYYQGASGGEWSTSGAIYFDSTGKMTSTGTPASGISTSNYVLTTNAAGVPVWTTTLDGGVF